MSENNGNAPGWPGMEPRWTSSAKSGVGTALTLHSRVWFTVSHGILNEIYYPRVDQACTRDCGLIVTDGNGFFSEEKRHTESSVTRLGDGVPAYRLTNVCPNGRYMITKDVIADPWRDVVLQRIQFAPLARTSRQYHLYVLLAPHIGNRGLGNSAWLADYKGIPMLFAGRDDVVIALACSEPWLKRSVGFVGVSDGWQDLNMHGDMRWEYSSAGNGNVALTAELNLASAGKDITVAIGFGRNEAEAALRARKSLQCGFTEALESYVAQWDEWFSGLRHNRRKKALEGEARVSASIIRIHEDKRFRGGIIASLSIPWGQAKGDDDLGGYHLVWVRDLVEAAEGLLAAGAGGEVRRVLEYLRATQESDGHWPQNMWLDGSQFWGGIQMDEVAFPILLLDLAYRHGTFDESMLAGYQEMVRRAAGFIVRNGPVTGQDRWEEDAGYSPFTLAVEIAALLAGADILERARDRSSAAYLRDTADYWNSNIERWCYVSGTDIARQAGVDGYYVRIAPPTTGDAASPAGGFVPIKNRPAGESTAPASHIVSTDALALVRFGLREPDDPRIVNTVRVIDMFLKSDLPPGPAWHRYNGDGYGEHDDGTAYDGTGTGRAWPLLTGERAHFELRAGNIAEARRLAGALGAFGGATGLLPEQLWDSPDIPGRELFLGKPSGSAMPLVWAHAEHVKILRSLEDGRVFDGPSDQVQRHLRLRVRPAWACWKSNNKIKRIEAGNLLRIELSSPAMVHWTFDGWHNVQDLETIPTTVGAFYCDLPSAGLDAGTEITFTFLWKETNMWEGENYSIAVCPPESDKTIPARDAVAIPEHGPLVGSPSISR